MPAVHDLLPDSLYRYRGINEHAHDIIVNHRLYFSRPESYNDPFDCQLLLNFRSTDKRWKDFFEWRGQAQGLARKQAKRLYNNFLFRAKSAPDKHVFYERYARGFLDESRINTTICGFSTDGLNLLMFGHYGDKHEGLCLEFDKHIALDLGFIKRVQYSDTYPELDILKLSKDPLTLLQNVFSTKARQWEYEREWRAIRYGPAPGHVTFQPRNLVSVTIGCRAKPEKIEQVKQWMKSATHPVLLWRAIQSRTGFALSRERI